MEMEMNDDLGSPAKRSTASPAAASLLEQTVDRLEEKIAAAEQKLTALEARAAAPRGPRNSRRCGFRKTLPTAMTTLLAKQGVTLDSLEPRSLQAGSLDAALSSLSAGAAHRRQIAAPPRRPAQLEARELIGTRDAGAPFLRLLSHEWGLTRVPHSCGFIA